MEVTALLERAVARHRGQDLAAADALYRQCLALAPSDANALHLRGRLLGEAGRADGALAWLFRAVRVAPGVAPFRDPLAAALLKAGREEEAAAQYVQGLRARHRKTVRTAGAAPDLHPLDWRQPCFAVPRREPARPRVLFLNERWMLLDAARETSNCNLYGVEALAGTGLADAAAGFVDAMHYDTAAPADAWLGEAVERLAPDHVVFTPQVDVLARALDPSPECLGALKRAHGFALSCILYDSADDWGVRPALRYDSVVDRFVVLDLPQAAAEARLPGRPVLGLWAAPFSRLFHAANGPRDIPVSFVGMVRKSRAALLGRLAEEGIAVHVAGGQRGGKPLSFDDYADLLRRSLMTINLSLSQSEGAHHVKARVFEALACGALLLESDNGVTPQWLEPMRHYVPFADAADLARKIRHFTAHPGEARAIAEAGREAVRTRYGETAFWQRFLALNPRSSR